MKKFDKIFLGLIIGCTFPLLFCLLSVVTWFYLDMTENNLVIYTIIIFFSGVTCTWFIIDKLWIGPKNIIIEQLKMGIYKDDKLGKTVKQAADYLDV